MMTDLFQKYIPDFENNLRRIISQKDIPSSRLEAAIEYSLFSGGKRFRPLLVYLSGELLGAEREPLNIVAAAVEMVHCYSLIHDDLPAMDDDDFRRGRPSCHVAFDQATAILAGDALAAWAVELLVSELPKHISADKALLVCKRLLLAIGVEGMISGQSLDLTVLSSCAADEKDLELVHKLKTGCLIQSCILMVADLIPVEKAKLEVLEKFSNDLGLVFQMQDDYLDRFAPGNVLGKMRSSDNVNNKITYAGIYDKDALKNKINVLFANCYEVLSFFTKGESSIKELVTWLQSRVV